MRTIVRVACGLLPFLLSGAGGPAAFAAEGTAPTYREALTQGTWSARFRYRYELVMDDTPAVADRDGNASTLRSTVGYRTAAWHGFSGMLEFEDVADLGLGDDHNNAGAGALGNGATNRPVVADPKMTEVNQVYLRYTPDRFTAIQAGRQEINLGDERFVGAVGWRQNHQSFDGVRLTSTMFVRTSLDYAFVGNVNRIFGDDQQMKSHLLRAEFDLDRYGQLAPYFLRLDYDSAVNSALSTTTVGASWSGKLPRGGWSFPWHAEAAHQGEAADNPANVDAWYMRFELGAARPRMGLRGGYEVLQGAPGDGRFTTPLATLHKWNGWADKFLNTPADGLRDAYLAATGTSGRFNGSVVLHRFRADHDDRVYGRELDVMATWQAPWTQTFGAKLAVYDARDFGANTRKLMVWSEYGF